MDGGLGSPTSEANHGCLNDLFEYQVDRHPDSVALISPTRSLTYAELDMEANRLARLLRERGGGPGTFVGICFGRSELPIVSILACLKAGCAYVPLEPGFPDERLRFIIDEAEIAIVMTEWRFRERIASLCIGQVVALDAIQSEISSISCGRLTRTETGLVPSDVCYVLYTSGTTGRPKGVVTEHRNVTRFVSAFNKVCTTTGDDRVFQGFALGFDGSVEEAWMAFSNGAALVVGDSATPRFGNELARHLAKSDVTFLSTIPTLLSTITEDIPSLRQLVVSGEACPPELVVRWSKPGRRILNVYGPTEATVNTTAAVLKPGRPVTIGHPLEGYETLVLDAQLRPVPKGEKGELFIGGPTVSRGYLKQPDLTRRTFIDLYPTGDLARANESGELEIVNCRDGDPHASSMAAMALALERRGPYLVGRAQDGCIALVLDWNKRPVGAGEVGELFVGRPSSEKPNATFDGGAGAFRLYRTGDLTRVNDDGELEFFGRIDSQVKIRGYRIELSEIETVLLEQPEIRSAVVRVHQEEATQCLAAYVVQSELTERLDRSRILAALRDRLPRYMVPTYLDVLDALPMLASGKIDRKGLPSPVHPLVNEGDEQPLPRTPLEQQIAAAWSRVFKTSRIGLDQDFFLDLGGHSLLAAQATAILRSEARIDVAVRDIYACPTVRKLAERLEAEKGASNAKEVSAPSFAAKLTRQYRKPGWAAIVVQAIYLLSVLPAFALPIVLVLPSFMEMLRLREPIGDVIALLLAVGVSLWLALLTIAIVSKWSLIGRYKPGAYPLWGNYYLRWWVASRLQHLSGMSVFNGTPLAPVFWRLMGARVGTRCVINAVLPYAWDCIAIGDDVSIGDDTQLPGLRVENGYLLIGRVDIGNRCFIGSHSALGLDVRIGDDSCLDDQSLLPDGEEIPGGEMRRGSPAQRAELILPEGAPRNRSRWYLGVFSVAQMLAGLGLTLMLTFPILGAAIASSFLIMHTAPGTWIPLLVGGCPLLVIAFCFWSSMCYRLVRPPSRSATYDVYSWPYLRVWLASSLMHAVRFIGLPIFTTLYLPPWMRLLGARLGKHTEMSTVWRLHPSMLSAGDGVFFADGCMLIATRMHLGRIMIRSCDIGDRTFIGNNAAVPAGTDIGSGCLIGVLSAPATLGGRVPDGSDWLGSPGFRLPSRQVVGGFDERTTFRPSKSLYVKRAMIDAMRVLLPVLFIATMAAGTLVTLIWLYDGYGTWGAYFGTPFIGWAVVITACAVTVGVKWAVMGRFRPVIVPLWSSYVWLNELVNGLYETIMAPIIANLFGTPFAAPVLRLLGCRIGRYCYIETNLLSEFDLVEIGDYVALNSAAVIQNHLFEDRIMKSSHLRIGDGCTVGYMSVVLYDTRMEEGAVLGPLSLLMKGERMPAGSRWHGIPTVRD